MENNNGQQRFTFHSFEFRVNFSLSMLFLKLVDHNLYNLYSDSGDLL